MQATITIPAVRFTIKRGCIPAMCHTSNGSSGRTVVCYTPHLRLNGECPRTALHIKMPVEGYPVVVTLGNTLLSALHRVVSAFVTVAGSVVRFPQLAWGTCAVGVMTTPTSRHVSMGGKAVRAARTYKMAVKPGMVRCL